MANSLPMTLRVYQKLSAAMVPLAPALIKRRLKQGKEDPARVSERRGMSRDVRPHGPLVWIHGASVGEVLAAAALIEKLRALNIRILLTSGTVTSAAIVAKRFPADIIHQYVPYDSPRYVARFLDHWRPSLALFIESDLWPNLILASAARRLPLVLINGLSEQNESWFRNIPFWRRYFDVHVPNLLVYDGPAIHQRIDSGAPISVQPRANSTALSGVTSDGLRSSEAPAASAAMPSSAAFANGKFHGMINPTTG